MSKEGDAIRKKRRLVDNLKLGPKTIVLGEKGRIVLPADMRKEMKAKKGDELVAVMGDDGRVVIVTAKDAVNRAAGAFPELRGAAEAHISRRDRESE